MGASLLLARRDQRLGLVPQRLQLQARPPGQWLADGCGGCRAASGVRLRVLLDPLHAAGQPPTRFRGSSQALVAHGEKEREIADAADRSSPEGWISLLAVHGSVEPRRRFLEPASAIERRAENAPEGAISGPAGINLR